MSSQTPAIHTIVFEDIRLPRFASFLDVAASLSPVGEETSVWFWHFTLCAGSKREDKSNRILRHCKALLAALPTSPSKLTSDLELKFPGVKPEVIMTEWRASLSKSFKSPGSAQPAIGRAMILKCARDRGAFQMKLST